MVLIAYVPLLFFLIGCVMMLVGTKRPVTTELAKVFVWIGFFWTMAVVAGKTWRVG